ncbi:MAG: UDP-3-O-acyl-N-acetylglucosamine deacetylase [Holosporales bacterium]|jgi:UDP-3-O-[3-hydroxymyristoyl] N-acetylglucosamine deacetylase|nr:UDP-3-O-acyl-N-acetylglucosamine deacetylase [Holosporales bacterium]
MYRHARHRATLEVPVEFRGVGVHSGNDVVMRVCPLQSDDGILFKRCDVPVGKQFIALAPELVLDPVMCTRVVNEHGISVAVVEHLLAALRICKITDAVVELDGDEVPVMDGSASVFVDSFLRIGLKHKRTTVPALTIPDEVVIRSRGGEILVRPSKTCKITVELAHERLRSVIGTNNSYSFRMDDDLTDVARARTFGWLSDYDMVRARGLARGASEDNTIVILEDGTIKNESGLRHEKEIVMHKCLDLIGDLCVLGYDIVGEINAVNPSHVLNNLFVREISNNFATDRIDGINYESVASLPA